MVLLQHRLHLCDNLREIRVAFDEKIGRSQLFAFFPVNRLVQIREDDDRERVLHRADMFHDAKAVHHGQEQIEQQDVDFLRIHHGDGRLPIVRRHHFESRLLQM